MARVQVSLKDGQVLVVPNTTVSTLITALGSGEGQASVTLENGEVTTISNETVESLVAQADSTLNAEGQRGEEPGSGHGTGGLPGESGQNL